MEEKDASEDEKDPKDRMKEDVELFHTLFPDVNGEDIPQEVWDRVEQGESLAASYALFAVMQYREEEKIRKINEENDKKALPRIQSGASDENYFSPEAVKKMTRSEIKENYDKILSSMEKWN
ncbi:MAG: hypothetical protein IKU24_04580 [Clostridia bacterium]|nr:hypothetical protein [Clostridia bacterium]